VGYYQDLIYSIRERKNPNHIVAETVEREKNKWQDNTLHHISRSWQNIFEKIVGATTSKEALGILQSAYKGADPVNQVRIQTLRAKFESLKIKDYERASGYIIIV
jgi:hypothetical protein